jgi:hypothetical protein
MELAGGLKDEYDLALRKLVKRKAAGRTIERPAESGVTAQRLIVSGPCGHRGGAWPAARHRSI